MTHSGKIISVESEISARSVKSRIKAPKDLEKYFDRISYYSSYDVELHANRSIWNIPVLSVILPLAWITGADVHVDTLDKEFTKSMAILQQEYKRIYPKAPFKTKLLVDELVENNYTPDGTALLFSGGLDSTYSLFTNLSRNPRLVMLFGTSDIPVSNAAFQEFIQAEYVDFAEQEKLRIHFIRTNMLQTLSTGRVNHLWMKVRGRNKGDFWNGIGFALGQIGQAAPLSIGRFNHLLFAAALDASVYSMSEHPIATSPTTDEKICWANLDVKHDGAIHRSEKVLKLRKLLKSGRIKLRVCWSSPEYLLSSGLLNCGKCEKCLRTIASLAHAGIDPNDCGFNVDNSTFDLMKILFEKKLLSQRHIKHFWRPLQDKIPDRIEEDIFGSERFFRWFKGINLDCATKTSSLSIPYSKLPYSILMLVRRFTSIILSLNSQYEHNIYQPLQQDSTRKSKHRK